MKHILAIVLILGLLIPAQRPICMLHTAANGRVICVCSQNKPGRMAWRAMPSFVCEFYRR